MYPSDATLPHFPRVEQAHVVCVCVCVCSQCGKSRACRKRKLSDNLFTEELQEDELVVHDWENYLDRLQILLLAYALAGVHPLSSAPAAAQELTLGADITEFVEAPLDVLMKFFHSAKRTTTCLLHGTSLAVAPTGPAGSSKG